MLTKSNKWVLYFCRRYSYGKTGEQIELLKKKISEYKEKLTAAIKDCNQVYITTHLNEDYDAIASIGAMALICKRFKKAPYIVVDQKDYDGLSVEKSDMYEALKDKNFVIINLDDFKNNRVENSLLIVLDTNKGFMTPLKNNYDDFNNIIVIDHHKTDDNTIKTKNKFILPDMVSSTSEMMYWILKQMKIKPKDRLYNNFLLTGISLDTNKKDKNMYPSTYLCISDLDTPLKTDKDKVDMYFSTDYESDRRVQDLVDEMEWITIRYGIAIDNSKVYSKEEVAKAADYSLKYTSEAIITFGKAEDGGYHVSARSNRGNVDIDAIMGILNGGGGNDYSASCNTLYVDAETLSEEKEQIFEKIKKIIYLRSRRKKPKKGK